MTLYASTVLLAAALGLIGSSAIAADVSGTAGPDFSEASPSPWTFAVAPYAFLAGLSGNVASFGAKTVHVSADFGDILDHLKFGAMGTAEARNGRFGVLTDFMYADLSGESASNNALGLKATVGSSTFTGTAMGEWRVAEGGLGSIDAMAGLRVWSVGTDVQFTAGMQSSRTFSDGATWVDPMIGAKGRLNFGTSPFYLTGWAMIGGFGIGADTDWDLLGGLGYDFNSWFSFVAGYRAIGVDYSHDGFVFDVVQQGPILGGVFRF